MRHKTTVERYDGTLRQLAVDLGNLRYDALQKFLQHLAGKLASDGGADQDRGRRKLATALSAAGAGVEVAADKIAEAWRVSKPFMKVGRR